MLLTPLLVSCGGKEETPTEPAIMEEPTADGGLFVTPYTSDVVEINPGAMVEIQTPTPVPISQGSGTILYDSANIESAELFQEKSGGRPMIHIQGFVPSPCHKLLIKIEEIDLENRVQIKTFSVINLDSVCEKQLQPFSQTIQIGLLPAGNYTVWTSLGKIGEFSVQ
jgi:hypothetical protein